MKQIFSFVLLFLSVTVAAGVNADEKKKEQQVSGVSHRRTRASLPIFSKSAKRDVGNLSGGNVSGKGSGNSYNGYNEGGAKEIDTANSYYDYVNMNPNGNAVTNNGYYAYQQWEWRGKSYKKSKTSKSDKKSKSSKKKDGKKDKKGKYEPIISPSKAPTLKPILSRIPTQAPTKKGGSDSGDIRPSVNSSSEDCPPARPPTVVPPSPNNSSTGAPNKEQPSSVVNVDKKNLKSVALDLYALDYSLSQDDRTPIKVDFLELQALTQSFFKDYMMKEYEISTQAELVDFTTSFVTAHFIPGDPIHIQYNSTAFFAENSINVPTSQTLFDVLEKSFLDPQAYINDVQSQVSDVNPFSSTTSVKFTNPKPTPTARSSVKSNLAIASAGVAAIFTLSLVAGIVLLREKNATGENSYEENMRKGFGGDVTVAGETYVSESQNSSRDCSLSTSSSKDSVEMINEIRSSGSAVGMRFISAPMKKSREDTKSLPQSENDSSSPGRRPRTVAEIERLLSFKSGDII